jgi:ABC-type multidrug transport system ATPase subunit
VAPALKIDGLSKRYGRLLALNDVSFSLEPGTITAILGPNGAGKTTTFKCVLGVTSFDGTVEVDGYSSRRQGKLARSRIGYLPQTPAFDEGDSCRQALRFLAQLRGADVACVEPLLGRVDLAEQTGTKVGHLSGGMRQRLALAAALISDPPLLLLDEPTANLDATSRRQLHDLVMALRDEGRTILVSTHFVDSLGDLADRVLILKEGALAYAGTVADLRRQAPSKRFVVHLNGTAPSEFVDALGAIGVKSDSIVPAAESWDDLLAKVTSGDETTDEGSG